MPDFRRTIQARFEQPNRFDVFGDVITRMHIQGFRCHTDTLIDVRSPITAFCGLNGTGKSTILQLAATAYQTPNRDVGPHFNISDFMVVGTLDPNPFSDDARVEYRFWQNNRSTRPVTLSRNDVNNRWNSYERRPQRQVHFSGIGLYLPKIEHRDFVVHHARNLVLENQREITENVRAHTASILSCHYDRIVANTVSFTRGERRQTGEVVSVERQGITYSEAHMGFGEARTQYLVSTLESLPPQCLVLIEEPETSLHPSAQYQLGQYLVDVVRRNRHQIFLTTHSMFLLSALPSHSINYLKLTNGGIVVNKDISPLQVRSLLSDGHVKALNVLVEDTCAAAILRQMLLRVDPDFLLSIDIQPAGDADLIANVVRALLETKIAIACVRDGDKNPTPRENIFKLPGHLPPEKELLDHPEVAKYIQVTYGVNLQDFRATLADIDHHDWFRRLAERVNQNEENLLGEVARSYAHGLAENEVTTLLSQLKEASR